MNEICVLRINPDILNFKSEILRNLSLKEPYAKINSSREIPRPILRTLATGQDDAHFGAAAD